MHKLNLNKVKSYVLMWSVVVTMTTISSFHLIGVKNALMMEPLLRWVAGTAHATGQPAITIEPSLIDQEIGFTPERIFIPSVAIDLPVVSVPLESGSWTVQAKVANYAEGTSLVNAVTGNTGIYGHDRIDAFTNIKKLNIGERIYVSNDHYTAVYEVTDKHVVNPNDITVFYPTDEPTLTILTCDGLFSEMRYVVTAVLSSVSML